MTNNRLRIALQKSGRLSDESFELLKNAGLKISKRGDVLLSLVENMDIEILKVRDDDIPGLVIDGVVDIGIVGENVLEEYRLGRMAIGQNANFNVLKELNFGDCRLSLAILREQNFLSLKMFEGKKIATTYPNLLKDFFEKQGINFTPVLLKGSVEVAPRAWLADAICDIVSSGATLEANGLKEVYEVFKSKAVLIKGSNELNSNKKEILEKLIKRIDGVLMARESKYIMMHAPKDKLDEIVRLLPGGECPTIIPLSSNDKLLAVHIVAKEQYFWETMEKVKALGASSILVLPIEKMMI